MFPRRSTVTKILALVAALSFVLFMWANNPENTVAISKDHFLLQEYIRNETQKSQSTTRIASMSTKFPANKSSTLMIQAKVEVSGGSDEKHDQNKTFLLPGNMTRLNMSMNKFKEISKDVKFANPHRFRYILNVNEKCADNTFLVTFIHTAPDHYKRRMLIRETWGNPKNFKNVVTKLIFLMGSTTNNKIQESLHYESDRFGDIVQEDFLDSYRNLTYKAISGLKWITYNCRNAKFVLKTDDDIFVHIYNLMNHLQSLNKHGIVSKRLVMCLVWYRMKVMRDKKSKWYVPKEEFKEDYFPVYCSGSAYLLSTDVAEDMYNASLHTPFFWVDDFYVTGLLAKKIGITHQKFNSVYLLNGKKFEETFVGKPGSTAVFCHIHNLNKIYYVWRKIQEEHGGHLRDSETFTWLPQLT